ncbi:hypothetical protein DACRYDRAFT_103924 [Dacryopinax primogenitus]|uniref:Uncharacterized protein n=1 Tax=Dacryopinax primogenitus (strain DJM 731) TaxID=1858805 RepID=M5G9G6_DACPD|nr:uncharacterized protein DACRYDRAFT_103924 [Dacryopinax primogenitus]EJU05439.1 hypothetical protein DACRYDRAFT_103924 [Dacryopinax primogenitus]
MPKYARGSTDPFYHDTCARAPKPFTLLVGNPHANSWLAFHSAKQLADELLFNCLHCWTAEETHDHLTLDCGDHSDELFRLRRKHLDQVEGLEDALQKSKEDLAHSLEENARLPSTLDDTRQLSLTAMKMISDAQQLASQARSDAEHFRQDSNNWHSKYDYIRGHLHSSLDRTDPPRAPSTTGAASTSSRPQPASSHEMSDDHDVPMDDSIIKEPASAPPQPSAVALGKCPAVDEPTSAPPRKVPSISMVMVSSGAPTQSKSYSSVASSAAGLPLTLAQTTTMATSSSSGANAQSALTQIDANSPSAVAAMQR